MFRWKFPWARDDQNESANAPLNLGQLVTLAIDNAAAMKEVHILRGINGAEAWIATKMQNVHGRVYYLQQQVNDTVKEPYYAPCFIVGSPDNDTASIRGGVYNVPGLEQGKWTLSSRVKYLRLENGTESAIVEVKGVEFSPQRENLFGAIVVAKPADCKL